MLAFFKKEMLWSKSEIFQRKIIPVHSLQTRSHFNLPKVLTGLKLKGFGTIPKPPICSNITFCSHFP